MKKVLVIAYYFPPTAGGGVQRTAKFVKYLPTFGWHPVVLTASNPDFDQFDDTLLGDIPSEVKVYKAYSPDPVRRYRIRRYRANSLFDKKDNGQTVREREGSGGLIAALTKAAKFILNNFVLVPDDYVGWIPFAVAKGIWIISRENIDVIYATGKPWSSFLIAFFLRFFTGKPYVLDLRDPWTLTPYGAAQAKSIKHKFGRFWERMCFSRAKKVIAINEQITNSYIQHYPLIPPDRFICITHGFDTDDFLETKRIRDEKFTISHVGTLYPHVSPDVFLRAVKDLIGKSDEFRNNLRIDFVGIVPPYVTPLIQQNGLEAIVNIVGYVPHRESIRYMQNSDVLLLLLNKVVVNANAQVSTGKMFEYLASRRPILALVPHDTNTAELITKLEAGKVVDPLDSNEIAKAVYDLYEKHKNGNLPAHSQDISRFSRKESAKQLSMILDQTNGERSSVVAGH